MKPVRVRQKNCQHCTANATVLYRVKLETSLNWIFLCAICRHKAELEHPDYTYGGTWKALKRH